MNNTVYFDTAISVDIRRQMLFDGQLFVYSPRKSSLAFIEHARQMIEAAFSRLDPEEAQHHMPVERMRRFLAS
jgi:hypothetical protein